MTRTIRTTSRACTAALIALLLSLTACGGGQEEPEAPEPAAEEPAADEDAAPDDGDTADDGGDEDEPESEPDRGSAPLADGTYEGRLVTIDTAKVTLELVRVLSGEEAVEAARADGVPLEDGELPNDVYVQDLAETVTLPVAGDGGFQIFDCSAGCELVGTTLDALATGQATPYGGDHAIMTVDVDAGSVVSLVEVYLP